MAEFQAQQPSQIPPNHMQHPQAQQQASRDSPVRMSLGNNSGAVAADDGAAPPNGSAAVGGATGSGTGSTTAAGPSAAPTTGGIPTSSPGGLPTNLLPASDPELARQVADVLSSEIGVVTMLNRLKASIGTAKEFALFLKKRSTIEEEHANGLKKLCRQTHASVHAPEHRAGSFLQSYKEMVATHDRMADNGLQFAASLLQMHDDLWELGAAAERSRKGWKQNGLAAETRVAEIEAQMRKSKAKYDALADEYERARTGDVRPGGSKLFGRGPKSQAQHEEDLLRKVQGADQDYLGRVNSLQTERAELVAKTRPEAVRAIHDTVRECDSGLTLQMQKYASFNEKLLLSNGLSISPIKTPGVDAARQPRSLREAVLAIDNDRDLIEFISSYHGKLPPRASDIKYERNPVLNPQPSPFAPNPYAQQQQQGGGPPGGGSPYTMAGGLGGPQHALQQQHHQQGGPGPGPQPLPQQYGGGIQATPPLQQAPGQPYPPGPLPSMPVTQGSRPGSSRGGTNAVGPSHERSFSASTLLSRMSGVGGGGGSASQQQQQQQQQQHQQHQQQLQLQQQQGIGGQQQPMPGARNSAGNPGGPGVVGTMQTVRYPSGPIVLSAQGAPQLGALPFQSPQQQQMPAGGFPVVPQPHQPQQMQMQIQQMQQQQQQQQSPAQMGPPQQPANPLQQHPPSATGSPLVPSTSNMGPSASSSIPQAPSQPVFGISLAKLYDRDGLAVPMVVYQCIQAVDLFGLTVEGIYRLSGSVQHVGKLKSMFDAGAGGGGTAGASANANGSGGPLDFRNPENFFHDVNSVAGLLKQFLRDLPDPLLTKEHYNGLIEAAKQDDDTVRRDSLHAIINNLPDPNYATLRALTLHLHRVMDNAGVNRMNSQNLSIVFGPTMMGTNPGTNIADAGWQVRVVDTILQNTYQIFDDD